ncbi:hypothetical protein VMCG_06621 [Cytospora schulzeri]|uniref:Protein kinase domain-containing protein n=1 Tax=Cytospora schulzeri TaxID=448051 RepID=A0A423W6Z6_9PEZI|nr:hypothetical protein VMCG_06621 [Valsa malicola]
MEGTPPWDITFQEFLHTFQSNPVPGSQSVPSLIPSVSPPEAASVASSDLAVGDFGRLLWAPYNFKPQTKPILRFLVESSPDGNTIQTSIKYLILQRIQGQRIRYDPNFFTIGLYKESEPFSFVSGFWNHADVSFTKEEDVEQEGVYYISANLSNETYKQLPVMDPIAIWTDKPVVEYVDLKNTGINLRVPAPGRVSDRIRVVTHQDFDDHKTKMVMKIWPTPVYNKDGLEREMMAYRACDGKDITPKFLGHVAEEGRIVGMLIEYIEGAHKPSNHEEKELCRQELDRLHQLTGWHRNVMENHKGNFLIKDGKVYIIDLGRAYTPQDVACRGIDWATKDI